MSSCKSYSHFFSKNIGSYAIFNDQSSNDTLTNKIESFEQLGPELQKICIQGDVLENTSLKLLLLIYLFLQGKICIFFSVLKESRYNSSIFGCVFHGKIPSFKLAMSGQAGGLVYGLPCG